MTEAERQLQLLEMTTRIVCASNPGMEDPECRIPKIYAALSVLGNSDHDETKAEPQRPEPAVAINKSVQPDYIVCLEDGKKFKILRRYIATKYNMTPEQYRSRWGLDADYPMVAPNYAARRSELAKGIGLGRKENDRRKAA